MLRAYVLPATVSVAGLTRAPRSSENEYQMAARSLVTEMADRLGGTPHSVTYSPTAQGHHISLVVHADTGQVSVEVDFGAADIQVQHNGQPVPVQLRQAGSLDQATSAIVAGVQRQSKGRA